MVNKIMWQLWDMISIGKIYIHLPYKKNNQTYRLGIYFQISNKIPTDPWNIPQTLNYLFMKEILSYLYFGIPGVCSRGLLEIS